MFLLSGLLAWNLFSVAVGNGTRSVIDNGEPREEGGVPARDPAARRSSASRSSTSCCSRPCLLRLHARDRVRLPRWRRCVLYPLSFVALLVFTTALTFWVSALNVRYRDVQHLIGLALLVWFWVTPIVYPGGLVQDRLVASDGAVVAAPVDGLPAEPADADRVGVPARAVRHGVRPSADTPRVAARRERRVARRASSALVLAGSLLLLLYTWRLFFRLSGDFAEEL